MSSETYEADLLTSLIEYVEFLGESIPPEGNYESSLDKYRFSFGTHAIREPEVGQIKIKTSASGVALKYFELSWIRDPNINLQTLWEAIPVAIKVFKQIPPALETLNQKIAHLQGILRLLPPSHPNRIVPYLQLGEDFIAVFQLTDELYHLNGAIFYYDEALSTGIYNYLLLRGLAKCLGMRWSKVRNAEDFDEAKGILLQVLFEIPFPHPYRHAFLYDLGVLMMEKYELNPSYTEVLQEAISYYRDALASCTETSNTDMVRIQSIIVSLCVGFAKQSEESGIEVDFHDLENLLRKLLDLIPITKPEIQNRLFLVLNKIVSFACDHMLSDATTYVIRQFVDLDSKLYPADDVSFCMFSAFFFALWEASLKLESNREILDEAITLFRDACVCCAPDEIINRMKWFLLRVGLLVERFKIYGFIEDSEEAIAIYREMLVLTELPVDSKLKIMKDYGEFSVFRFEKFSQVEDIENAISLYQSALTLVSHAEDHPQATDIFRLHFQLARALLFRAEKIGEAGGCSSESFQEAISCLRAAVAFPIDHVDYREAQRIVSLLAYYEANVPEDLHELSEDDGERSAWFDCSFIEKQTTEKEINPQELEDIIVIYRQSLSLQPFPHPRRLKTLICLGKALETTLKFSGGKSQLDEAVLHLREAVTIFPRSAHVASALMSALECRSGVDVCDSESYSNDVLSMLKQVLSIFPTTTKQRVMMERMVHEMPKYLNGDLIFESDINDVVQETVGDSNPFDGAHLKSVAYAAFFNRSGDIKHLNQSIYHGREAVLTCPDNYAQHTELYHDLGTRLLRRYEMLKKKEDLNEALRYYQQGIKALKPGNYLESKDLIDLGTALILKLVDFQYLDEMVTIMVIPMIIHIDTVFRPGVTKSVLSAIPTRFWAARLWARLADLFYHKSALEAYEEAINFLPRLSSMGTNVWRRQESFKRYQIDGVSRRAALFAIRICRHDRAIEFLEAGRAVFWLQAMHLRSPMDRLRYISPELETKLVKISAELDRSSMMLEAPYLPGNAGRKKRDEELFKLERLNEEWSRTLDTVRELEGFQDFLSPKKLSSLQASIDCPVIYLIPNKKGSHALVMLPNNVKHVELPNAQYEKLQELVVRLPGSGRRGGGRVSGVAAELYAELKDSLAKDSFETESSGRAGRPREFKHIDIEDHIRHVLQTLWTDVLRPIVGVLGLNDNCSAPVKVCWCPTGIFSFLPLHAAGIYGVDMSSIESASDYFISSYTPTVGALMNNKPTIDKTEEFKMMVVIDQKSLHKTTRELETIEKYVSPDNLVKLGVEGAPAFVDSVASHLSTVSIAHFACHGKQLPDQPLDSHLSLGDGNLKISRIMEQRMPKAALAFLCACETAMGDKDLPDEAMHLGATLLFSGFRGVVATMWSINDDDGPVVADEFYAHLFKDDPKNPNIALAAEGVHKATGRLRELGVGFQRWVPFIHLGI